jgi:hypothetical protein
MGPVDSSRKRSPDRSWRECTSNGAATFSSNPSSAFKRYANVRPDGQGVDLTARMLRSLPAD